MTYDLDAPLERAKTIPREWYLSTEQLAREREAVFHRSWQYVARADELITNGRFVTADIAGEPVLIVRGDDGVLRGFHNVCRHKGTRVLSEASGTCDRLRCRYHGWTYDLSGRLRGTPEWEGVLDFRRDDHGLVPLALEAWGPFVFACVRPSTSLTEALQPLIDRSAPLRLDTLRFHTRREYELACNWKVFVDNYLDGGYHVSTVHNGLAAALDYKQYTTECFDGASLQSSPLVPSADAVRTGDRAYYWWLWPNLMLNVYDGMMDTNLVLPLGPERCRVVIDFWFADSVTPAARDRSISVADEIQHEDILVSEEVQRGLQSVSYSTGRYSVKREIACHHFHRALATALHSDAKTTG